MPRGRWPTFAGPRGIYGGFALLGRALLPRTPFPGTVRGPLCGTGPFVCPMLVEIPIASTATEQNAESLNSFIKFLCQLNIIKILLLQVSTGTLSKLFRHWTNYLLDRKSTNECSFTRFATELRAAARSQLACCNL